MNGRTESETMASDEPNDDIAQSFDQRTLGRGAEMETNQSWSNDPLIGRQLGEYVIRRVIGRGGMGSVYEAFHVHLQKVVAIKVLASHLLDDPRAVERFRREMRTIGRINSPYIVQALDARLTGDVHYLVMEFVDGLDADELVRRLHGIPVEDACEIVRHAALGLQDAHQHELVHRDIKPKNIAVASSGKVKILDLGLALCKSEVMGSGRLTANAAIGSYQYMAPEQFDDSHDVDIRADLYSLGCTLYHLLTGNPPFSGSRYRTLTSLMEAHRSATPPPVTQFNGMVRPELVEVLQRLLAKSPDERLQTPGELAEMMRPFVEGANLAGLVAMARESDEEEPQADIATAGASPATKPERSKARPSGRTPIPLRSHETMEATVGLEERLPRKQRWKLLLGFSIAASLVVGLLAGSFGRFQIKTQLESSQLEELAHYTQLMPGLNGSWWLEETPWLLPPVRAAAAEEMSPNSSGFKIPLTGRIDPPDELLSNIESARENAKVQDLQYSLNDLFERLVRQSIPAIKDSFLYIQPTDPEVMDESRLREKMTRISEWYDGSSNVPTPLALHVKALALHKQGKVDEAESCYKEALKRYEEMVPSPLLEALCSADYGELLYVMSRYDDSALRFRAAATQVQDIENEHPEFVVYTLGREADSLRKANDSAVQARQSLSHASKVAEKLPEEHPLRAYLDERSAWLALDDWHVADAITLFESAIARRQRSMEQENRRAPFFIFFDKQAVAVAERLRGNPGRSKELLEDLVKTLTTAMSEKNSSPKQRSEMRGRYINTQERLADILLYAGEFRLAREMLQKDVDFIDQKRVIDDMQLVRYIDRIHDKLAFACAMDGKGSQVESLLHKADGRDIAPYKTKFRDLALLVNDVNAKKDGSVDKLADLILSMRLTDAGRDEMEFAFLAGRVYLALPEARGDQAVKVVRRIEEIADLIDSRADDTVDIERYLRPQYDVMVHSAAFLNEYPASELAQLMVDARHPNSSKDLKDTVVFYFFEKEGFVVDTDADGNATTLPLTFGFADIRAARAESQGSEEIARKIPENVRRRMQSLPPEKIYWADPVLEITDKDQPIAKS